MRVRKMLAGVFILCFAADGHAQALKAEIKLEQTVVNFNEDVSVTTTIRNTGAVEETLVVWTCSYPSQWRVDNPVVRVNEVACQQSVP